MIIKISVKIAIFIFSFITVLILSCMHGRPPGDEQSGDRTVIQNTGSDTIVNLAQAWAEAYGAIDPSVSVEVSGGGSGTGIAALINGTVDIANCSRKMHADEITRAIKNTGLDPVEFLVGFDALAIYVHKDNPMDEISIPQLAEIYGEKGEFTTWSQLSVELPKGARDEIIVVSRQSNSGTYEYFREAVLGKTCDFRLGTIDMHGSKDVVELVSRTPSAIGYSGMGYATDKVKMMRIARETGRPAFEPTVENTQNGAYPIARPLMMYTLGKPNETIATYLKWILSSEGQAMVSKAGYVPLTALDESNAALSSEGP
ncbi:phosphate ABC transporter substrate-binding protein [candidate division KSB1 bacterium]|nr:phosphate ABC transporter substrate-binding protein [candidate division KSB1 bacterium]